jgi:hypothetical protein
VSYVCFRSLEELLRRHLLSPTSARQPADSQGKQQHSSSTSERTALPASNGDVCSSTAAQQADVKLQEVYASMAADFSVNGLDLEAIADTASWFETGESCQWTALRWLSKRCLSIWVTGMCGSCSLAVDL